MWYACKAILNGLEGAALAAAAVSGTVIAQLGWPFLCTIAWTRGCSISMEWMTISEPEITLIRLSARSIRFADTRVSSENSPVPVIRRLSKATASLGKFLKRDRFISEKSTRAVRFLFTCSLIRDVILFLKRKGAAKAKDKRSSRAMPAIFKMRLIRLFGFLALTDGS